MPALSGSDKAYKQCRAGIERAGASRAGYFVPNAVVTINGVDVTSNVEWEGFGIRLERNDEIDTATFRLKPGTTVPSAGHTVVIGLGTAVNREFAGQVVSRDVMRVVGFDSTFVQVSCFDWLALFNRQLVTTDYSGQTATAIARDVIANHTAGFTDRNIADGLATIQEFIVINETPGAIFRRLANLINGAFYIDPNQDVHLFGSAGETGPLAPTPPEQLTASLSTLKGFSYATDVSQWRSRVIVEGKRTTCPLSIPADVTLPGVSLLPVEDSTAFSITGGVARIGTQVVTYTSRDYPVVPGENAEGARVVTAAAAGATSIEIDDNTFKFSTGTSWVQIGDQTIYFGATSGPAPYVLSSIPASGFGSIGHAIGEGESVRALGQLTGVTGLTLAQDAAVDVAVRAEVDDSAAQTEIASIEGGDGVHEHYVSDERLNDAGCQERASAELALFSDTLVRASGVSYDMNMRPGAILDINVAGLARTLTVESVTLDIPVPHTPPRRRFEAGVVKVQGAIEALMSV